MSQTRGRCPICGKPAVRPFRPFCSRRCGDLDLHRWLGGHYRVETEQTLESEADQAPDTRDERDET